MHYQRGGSSTQSEEDPYADHQNGTIELPPSIPSLLNVTADLNERAD